MAVFLSNMSAPPLWFLLTFFSNEVCAWLLWTKCRCVAPLVATIVGCCCQEVGVGGVILAAHGEA